MTFSPHCTNRERPKRRSPKRTRSTKHRSILRLIKPQSSLRTRNGGFIFPAAGWKRYSPPRPVCSGGPIRNFTADRSRPLPERLALAHIAALHPDGEGFLALGGGAVGEGIGDDEALRASLDIVVTNG